jgi:hypothetical protein
LEKNALGTDASAWSARREVVSINGFPSGHLRPNRIC